MSPASSARYTERRTSFSLILAGVAGGVMLVSIIAALLGFGGPRTVSTSTEVNVAVPGATPAQPPRQWTARIAWKARDSVNEAIKNCKDRDCLYRVLQQRSAPAETVDFVRDMQSITSDSELGYPTAFHGKGKVKAVEVFFPGLGMEGMSDFVFVNGPGGMLRPKLDFDAMARGSAEYQQFKASYPQVTPWDGMTYAKEVRSPDGSQTFQFTQTLLNGCHACALLGTARLGISFDATGNYIGTSIIGVEPDQSAAYSSLKDELSQKSQFFSSIALTKADGTAETAQAQTTISDSVPPYSSPKQCRFSVNMNPTMTSGWFMLDNIFDIRSVVVARSPGGPGMVPQGNTLTISCADSAQCITPIYSDKRGAQPQVPSIELLVPPENVDAVISDFNKLRAMCRP